MDFAQAVRVLSGKKSVEQNLNSGPVTTQVISGRVVSKSTDGQVQIEMDGSVYGADDSQYITVDTVGGLVEGDEVTLLLSGHYGYGLSPFALGSTGSVDRIVTNVEVVTEKVTEIYADYVKASLLQADVAELGFLTANSATITDLAADTAKIHSLTAEELSASTAYISALETDNITAATIIADNAKLGQLDVSSINADVAKIHSLTAEEISAATGYIAALTTGSVTASDIIADKAKLGQLDVSTINTDHAVITNLDSNYAHITQGVIDNATIGHASVNGLSANYAHLSNGVIDNATIGYADVNGLSANYAHITNGVIDTATIGYADVNGLSANYAQINLENVNNSWITNGIIKNAAISDVQIIGVSANKLTAGTIDASQINVANLRADSLIVNKINGQPILGGYVAVDSTASGYSSKNPKTQGWYEIQNGSMVATNDTTVNASKAYYTTSTSVALYDQTYIDGIETTLNNRIDGAIETFTGTVVPTLTNYPYTDWYDTTTSPVTDNRAEHVGDIYYVVNASSQQDGYCYRFTYDNTTSNYSWVLIKDSDVTAALSDITDLQTFQSNTTSWMSDTDEGLVTIRQNHTTLSGVVDKTVKASTQLWYTKANTTAPSKPTSKVTSTSTSGNAWRTVVPEYNASYPNYYYCWQYEFVDGTFGWSAVIRDIAMGESQAQGRQGVADAATAQGTANANIKSSVQLWMTKANNTAPNKPSSVVSSTGTSGNAWSLVVPTYSVSYPYYFYCYQQQKGDGTYQWTDVVYDQATSEAMKKAQEALPASTFTTFQSTTFKEVTDTVDEQTTTITNMSTVLTNNGLTSSTNISNTVNTVSQTATSNSSKISNITAVLGTNADGTTKTGDIVHRTSAVEQDLSGFKTTVSETYATQTETKQYGEGTGNPVVAADAIEAPLRSLDADGWAEQFTTSGKNLFDKTTASDLSNWNTSYTYAAFPITVTSGQTYIFDYVGDLNPGLGFYAAFNELPNAYDTDDTRWLYHSGGSKKPWHNNTWTATGDTIYLHLYPKTQESLDLFMQYVGETLQVELGSTATAYEPYTGGAPSPSPDYPQEIQVARGRNLIGSSMFIPSSGSQGPKSIDSFGYMSAMVINGDGRAWSYANRNLQITLKRGTYTVTPSLKSGSVSSVYYRIYSSENVMLVEERDGSTSATFTVESETTIGVETKIYGNIVAFQLTEGSTPQPYVPYGYVGLEVTYDGITTVTQIPLPSTGFAASLPDGTCDELHVDSAGHVEWVQNTLKIDVLVDENTSIPGYTYQNTHGVYIHSVLPYVATRLEGYCSIYPVYPRHYNRYDSCWLGVGGTIVYMVGILDHMGLESAAEFKAAMLGKTISFLIPTKTPITHDMGYISMPQLSAGCSVTIPELDEMGVSWYCTGSAGIAGASGDIANRISHAESSITQNANNIELKVSKDGVISSINQSSESVIIDAAKVNIAGAALFTSGRLSESSLNSAYDASGAASSALTSAKSYADTKKTEAINSANSTTDTKLENYSTTTAMNTAISTAVDNIEVGGRNLWILAEVENGHFDYGTGVSGGYPHVYMKRYYSVSPGDEITYQHWNPELIDNTSQYNRIEWYDSSKTYLFSEIVPRPLSSNGTYIMQTFIAPTNAAYVRLGAMYDNGTSSLKVKFERGNKPTDWTPAPEDVDSAISAVSTVADAAAPKTSAIKRTQRIYYQSNSTTAPSTPGTSTSNWVTDTSGSASRWTLKRMSYASATPYIWTCEQKETVSGTVSYTSVLLDDTTTVIDGGNIITGSIAANKLDVYDATIQKIRTSAIDVSSYSTTEQMNTAISTAVDNIEVGGKNLLRNTANPSTTDVHLTRSTLNGDGSIRLTPTSSYASCKWKASYLGYDIYKDDIYTVSCDAKKADVSSSYESANLVLTIGMTASSRISNAFNASYDRYGNSSSITDVTTNWKRHSFTVIVPTDLTSGTTDALVSGSFLTVQINAGSETVPLDIRNVKLERGNKATDWTPAPEDTDASILSNGVEYIAGTQTASTGTWTGITKDASLYDGKTIAYHLPYAGSGNATLTLTLSTGFTTAAIPIYQSYSTSSNASALSQVSTHWPAGSTMMISYDAGNNRWIASNYNTNIDTINRTRWQNLIKAAEAITSGRIICGTSTGYKNIAASVSFDLSYPLLYCGTTKAANETSDNNFLQINGIKLTNNGSVQSAANYQAVYLKGTISGNTFTIASTNFLTCTIPSSEDGFFYIPLGMFYDSTTNIYFNSTRELWAYLDGAFRQVNPTDVVATQRIYNRRSAAATLTGPTDAWVTTATNVYAQWTTKVPPLAASTASGQTKYPYLYTCEQRKRLDGTIKCTAVTLDENTTVIDGGTIVTGSISANRIDATSGTFDTANIPNLSAAKITSGDISADRIKTNVISAINSLTAGTIDAARINAANLSIGYSQLTDTPTIPSSVSDLNDGSNYSTTTQMNTAISNAVDSIEVGGRNLLRNTANPSSSDICLSRATLNNDGTIRLTPTTSGGSCKWRVDYLDYADYQGETYTISCDAKLADVTTSYTDVVFYIYAVVNVSTRLDNVLSSSYDAYRGHTFNAVTSNWQRFSITVNVPTDITNGTSAALVSGSQLTAQFSASRATKPIDIRNIKLECGNKPTDWTAAPEDTVNYLTTVDNTGIMVHSSNDSTSGVKVTSVVDIMLSGVSVANYGSTARIGRSGYSHVEVKNDGMSVYGNSGDTELIRLKQTTTGNYAHGELDFTGSKFARILLENSNRRNFVSFQAEELGLGDTQLNLYSVDNVANKSASIKLNGSTGSILIAGALSFLAGDNSGSNIIGIYAGSTTATLSNGNWASLASKSTLEDKLGSGVTNTNTIIIAQNGDCNAVGNYVFSGAITNDGAARGYIYPSISGAVRWNWIAIRFSN